MIIRPARVANIHRDTTIPQRLALPIYAVPQKKNESRHWRLFALLLSAAVSIAIIATLVKFFS